MNRTISTALATLVVLGAGAITAQAQSTAGAAGVRDRAGMFSADAVKQADEALREVRRKTHWSVLIETVETLDGKDIKEVVLENAKALQEHGLYILIDKKEHKFRAEPSNSAKKAFNHEAIGAITSAITGAFKAGKFDEGLLETVTLIRHDAEAAPDTKTTAAAAPAPAARPAAAPGAPVVPAHEEESILPMLLLGGGAVLVVLWLLSRAFRRAPAMPQQPYTPPGGGGYRPASASGLAPQPQPGPGYAPPPPGYGPQPQPGYGYGPPPPQRGGGGFMSGLLGGAAGAVAGNILYDQYGRPHEAHGAPPHVPGGVVPPQGNPWPQGDSGAGVNVPPPPAETYDPNAGGGGDWGPAEPAASSEPDTGAGGDWGSDQPEPDTGAGGDWGSNQPEPDAGAGGDWGSDSSGTDDNQGGSW